jgi:hypothetical protein
MPNPIKDLYKADDTSFDYIYEENVTVPLEDEKGLVRCNVYRPKDTSRKYPVLVTYGPYGKDIHYSQYAESALLFSERFRSNLSDLVIKFPWRLILGNTARAPLATRSLGNPRPWILDQTRIRHCAGG